jgi:HEAT repeat protein
MRRLLLAICLSTLACRGARTDGVREWEEKLNDSDPAIRAKAARELGNRGAQAASSVDKLMAALSSADADERQSAATALGRIGPGAGAAVPALIDALKDEQWPVRRAATLALGEIGDPRALAAIESLRTDPDSLVRNAATRSAKILKKE